MIRKKYKIIRARKNKYKNKREKNLRDEVLVIR